MQAFAAALPKIRARTAADLARPGLPREKVLATVVQLLEKSLIRVGNDGVREGEPIVRPDDAARPARRRSAARRCGSSSAARAASATRSSVNDRRLARIVKSCRDLPGQELFQYVDDDGQRRDVGSGDVNDYLKEITGEDFTAKDFRTWAGHRARLRGAARARGRRDAGAGEEERPAGDRGGRRRARATRARSAASPTSTRRSSTRTWTARSAVRYRADAAGASRQARRGCRADEAAGPGDARSSASERQATAARQPRRIS